MLKKVPFYYYQMKLYRPLGPKDTPRPVKKRGTKLDCRGLQAEELIPGRSRRLPK